MHRPHQYLQNMKFSCLYLFPFAHKVVPQFVPHFGPFLGPLRPQGPPKVLRLNFHILMHRPYRDLHNLKFSCLYLIPFAHKVVPQKASGRGSYTTLQLVNMGIIDEWYTVFQKIKIPHGLILPVWLMSQTFELSFPAFILARC